jgi:hypothetical protein
MSSVVGSGAAELRFYAVWFCSGFICASFFFFLFSFFFYIHRYFDFRYIICAEDEDELDDEGIDVGTPKHVCRQCQTHGRA